MPRTQASAILALALSLLSLTPATAQDAEKHVFVTVLGSDGAPIAGLTAEYFAVRESGKDRPVARVELLRTPMHVAVLVDTNAVTGATHPTFRSDVAEFIERLAAFNHVALYSFGDRAAPLVRFTQNAVQLRSAATTMFGFPGRACMLDAIDLALRDFELIEPARPVIVAITSESPEASQVSAGRVIKRLISSSTAFHAISLASTAGPGGAARVNTDIPSSSQRVQGIVALGEGDRERDRVLKQGTSTTGGSLQRLTSTLAVAQAFTRLTREFSNTYRVSFTRPGGDKIKDLEVGIMLEGATLRATAAPFGTR